MRSYILLICCLLSSLSQAQIPNELSAEDKVYGLSKFWQEVNFSYIYYDQIDQLKWNALFKQYISEVQQTENDYQYYRLIQKFSAYLEDGHTDVWLPKYLRQNIFNGEFGDYHFYLKNFSGRAIVSRVNKSKSGEIPVGSEIITVNDIPVAKYMKEYVEPYVSSSTAHVREDRAVEYLLEAYQGTKFKLTFRLPSGLEKELNLSVAACAEDSFVPAKEPFKLVDLNWQANDIAVLSINSFNTWDTFSEFKEKLPELQKAKGLIIDLRENGGGNSGVAKVVLHYLTKDTIFYGPRSQSRKYIPTLKAWNQSEYYHDFPYRPDTLGIGDRNLLKGKRVVVPTAILIGHGTASAAEDFLIYSHEMDHMIKIGEPTYGSTGMPLMFQMPGGGVARVCTKKDTYPDGTVFVGVGIQPDIEVSLDLEDFLADRDSVLQQALNYLNNRL